MLSQQVCFYQLKPFAGGPTITYTAPSFTFNTSACASGARVVTANTAGSLVQSANSTTVNWAIQAIENGGTPQTIRTYTTSVSSNIPISVNDLIYNNTQAHTSGHTLAIQLACTSASATCSNTTLKNGTTTVSKPFTLASTTYSACAVPAPVGDNWWLALLGIGLGVIGMGFMFRKQTA